MHVAAGVIKDSENPDDSLGRLTNPTFREPNQNHPSDRFTPVIGEQDNNILGSAAGARSGSQMIQRLEDRKMRSSLQVQSEQEGVDGPRILSANSRVHPTGSVMRNDDSLEPQTLQPAESVQTEKEHMDKPQAGLLPDIN